MRIGLEREAPILELDSAAKVALYDVLPYWLRLSLHPNLLAPIAPGEHGMIVHYAALAWTRDRTNARRTFVKWALQIVDAYRVVVRDTPPDHVGLFMRPVVKIDVGHRVRIGFLPLDEDGRQLADMPREIRARWPRCDERALVYLIGTLLARMSEVEDTDVQQLIARASASASRRRFANLQQLAEALRALVDVTAIPSRNEWVAWQHFERAVGLLELERPKLAREWFERALALDRDLMVAQEGIELIGAVLGLVRERRPRPSPVERPLQLRPVSELWSSLPAHVPWAEIEPRGVALERERDFRGALDLYRRAANDVRTNVALFTARARCHLELDETGEAIDYAHSAHCRSVPRMRLRSRCSSRRCSARHGTRRPCATPNAWSSSSRPPAARITCSARRCSRVAACPRRATPSSAPRRSIRNCSRPSSCAARSSA
ncbi:MAG TPA: hypothetical protein VFS15_28410 [Kofleriaceae bacterium]|nr:hypothetical protein [Kofleriaceae bacterium]